MTFMDTDMIIHIPLQDILTNGLILTRVKDTSDQILSPDAKITKTLGNTL